MWERGGGGGGRGGTAAASHVSHGQLQMERGREGREVFCHEMSHRPLHRRCEICSEVTHRVRVTFSLVPK